MNASEYFDPTSLLIFTEGMWTPKETIEHLFKFKTFLTTVQIILEFQHRPSQYQEFLHVEMQR